MMVCLEQKRTCCIIEWDYRFTSEFRSNLIHRKQIWFATKLNMSNEWINNKNEMIKMLWTHLCSQQMHLYLIKLIWLRSPGLQISCRSRPSWKLFLSIWSRIALTLLVRRETRSCPRWKPRDFWSIALLPVV